MDPTLDVIVIPQDGARWLILGLVGEFEAETCLSFGRQGEFLGVGRRE
jgi:hypothetical protein